MHQNEYSYNNVLLPWLTTQWERLLKQTSNQQLPHAFLFTGSEGVGKARLASYFASYLLCERTKSIVNGAPQEPCGQCKQCLLFESETHPDYKFLEPQEGSSAIKIDQIRALVDFYGQSSQQGGRRVAILSPAEALNNNAANALLKTLEEPGSHSVIILISHQPGMLLPTIRSRCQVVEFSMPNLNDSYQWLKSQVNLEGFASVESEHELYDALSMAYYSPLKALEYIETDALNEYKKMLEELGFLLKNECLSSTLAARWNDDMAVLRLSWMMLWLEQILKLKSGENLRERHPAGKMFFYLSEKTSYQELLGLYDLSLKQYKLFLGTSNPNKVLAFELLLHRWSALMRKPIV